MLRLLPALLLLPWAQPGNAAEEIADLLERDWFEVEFFVFERSSVMEHNTNEVLVRRSARRWPREMIALDTGEEIEPPANLDIPTRLCLDYPTLEYTITTSEEPDVLPPGLPAELPGSVGPLVTDEADQISPAVPSPEDLLPPPEPDPREELLSAVAEFEKTLLERSNRWQDAQLHQLARQARQVERRGLGRVLFHGRWLQAVPARDAPQPVLLQAGTPFPGTPQGQTWELQGTVAVTLGRYLHFQPVLFYEAPALGLDPAEVLLRGDGAFALEAPEAPAGGFMLLNQSRRMRSGEVHYVDHPKLGVVVRIDPVAIPEALTVALEALEDVQQ